MKNLTLLLALAISLNTFAVEPAKTPSVGTVLINAWMIGAAGIVVFDYINVRNQGNYSEDGAFMSLGVDPKMAVSENALDGLFRSGVEFSKNRIYMIGEYFPELEYTSCGLAYDRTIIDRKMSLNIGAEALVINRNYGVYYSVGLITDCRYNVNDWLSFSLLSRATGRPDISKTWIFSNYIIANFKF